MPMAMETGGPQALSTLLKPQGPARLSALLKRAGELEKLERLVRGALPATLKLSFTLGNAQPQSLTLMAASPAVATQLRFHQGAVLTALSQAGTAITHLRVRVAQRPPQGSPGERRGNVLPQGSPAPKPTALAISLLTALAEEESGPLGEALNRLARRGL
jgi:hypothetical protein